MDKPEPYEIGSVVDYHGSHAHGRYVITSHQDPQQLFPADKWDQLADAYPDGVAYEIWKEGVLRKFGNRVHSVYRVRRDSLTPAGKREEAPEV